MARNFLQDIVFVVFLVNSELTLGELKATSSHLISMPYTALQSSETFSRNSESLRLQNKVRSVKVINARNIDLKVVNEITVHVPPHQDVATAILNPHRVSSRSI